MMTVIPGGAGLPAGAVHAMQWHRRLCLGLLAVCALFVLILLSAHAFAAAPPAGSVIGNQATASYTDAAGVARTTTSNLVETSILQVAGVDVEADQSKTGAAGSTVYLPHTVTNTGNGSDIFSLATAQVAGGGYSFSNILIYADANGDGVPDNFDPITVTPALAAGISYNVVVAAQIPAGAAAALSSSLTLTATSQHTGTVTDVNTDSVTVSGDVAVVPVTKSLSVQSGPAGTPVVVTLTYTNNGTRAATDLTLTDVLDSRYSYVDGSGRWSVSSSATALTDDDSANPSGISYSVSGQKVEAVIASVAPGQSGWVRFTATIQNGTAPGLVPNSASIEYDNGSVTVTDQTNISNFTVTQTASKRSTPSATKVMLLRHCRQASAG